MKSSRFVLTLLTLTPLFGLGCRGDEAASVANTAADSLIGREAGQVRDDNGLKMKLAWCPPGTVTMEQVDVVDEPATASDTVAKGPPASKITPVKTTLTHGFWIGTCEVTQAQWKQVMETEPWKDAPKKHSVSEGPDFPATCVNWFDAMEFCCRLTGQERAAGRLPDGWEYTLPSEAQWEYACRAGTETKFSFGDDAAKAVEYAWVWQNTSEVGESWPRRVGQKKPNAWGLYDMHGNVLERCRDVFARLPGGRDPEVWDTSGGWRRVVRGGFWNDDVAASSRRDDSSPIPRGTVIGFRAALRPGDDKLTAAALKDLKDSVPALRETPDSPAATSPVARKAGVLPGDSREVANALIGIDALGGEITRDFDRREAPVVRVEFGYSNRFKDSDLAHLTPFASTIRELGLSHSASDATLPLLTVLPELRILWLFDTEVTDTGVKSLSGIRNLEKLCLTSTAITDAALEDLAELPKLKKLDLDDTGITDAGLRQLAKLSTLKELDLTGTKVTEAARRELETALPGLSIVTWEAGAAETRETSPLVGTASEKWSADDLEGKTHSLEGCRGKVVILDFWFRNCGWCVRAMPQVKEVASHFEGRPVVVFGMNTDENEEDAMFIVKKMGIAYPTLRAIGVPAKYKVDGFPTLIIVDQEGIIRDVRIGYSPNLRDEVTEFVERLLTRDK